MKKLKLHTGGNPITNQDFTFMQEAIAEIVNALISSMALNLTAAKVKDCGVTRVINGANATYTCAAGYVWFNNEIFQVDAHEVTGLAANYCYFAVVTEWASTGKKLFPDNLYKDCHEVRKAILTTSATLPTDALTWDGISIQESPDWVTVTDFDNAVWDDNISAMSGITPSKLKYRVNFDGTLHITGAVHKNALGGGTNPVIFTIPLAHRPHSNFVQYNSIGLGLFVANSLGEVFYTEVSDITGTVLIDAIIPI